MNCININSSEFKNLVEKTGIPAYSLDYQIAKWQEANNSFDFPSLEELNFINSNVFEKTGAPQYLQTQTSEVKTNEDLNTTIKNFLNKIGVSYQAVENLRDSQGNSIEGVALANMLDKIIKVVEGKAGIDTLPEEASHFFVEMLPEDSHIFQTMFNSIENYDIYKDTLEEYKDNPLYISNPSKLKKEAMAKLIARHIVDNFQGNETEKNIDKANKWWNLLWNWVKKTLFKFNTKEFYKVANKANAFQTSADMILKGDISELSGEALNEEYLQITPSDEATKVKNKIKEVADRMFYDPNKTNAKGKQGTYSIKNKEGTSVKDIKNRTSDIVEELDKSRGWAERTAEEKIVDKKAAAVGNKIHSALNNIITRFSEALSSNLVTSPNTHGITDNQYGQLKAYAENLMNSYDPGTIFLSETPVYNEKQDRAGTIDLIAIRPDGTVDLYDWKSTNLTGKSGIPFYKEENWNVQLTSYKNTLKSYGVTKFGKIRVIPIATKFDSNMNLKKLVIGTKELEQVPITGLKGSDVEFTGDESIDKLIEVLVDRLTKVSEIKVRYDDIKQRQLKIARIEKLKASIKELQLQKTYDAFLDEATFELNFLKNTGVNKLSNDEIIAARKVVNFYARLLEQGYVSKGALKNAFEDFSKIQASASFVLSQINSEIEKRAIKTANEVGINDVLSPQEESTTLGRMFRSISQSEHPVIQSFYRLVSKQKDKLYTESKSLYNNISIAVQELQDWGKSQGLSGTDIFKPLLKFTDGKWTGNLISKFKNEYYSKRDAAIAGKTKEDLQWLKENTVFNDKRFNELKTENIKTWNTIFKDDKNKEVIIKKKISDFDNKFNPAVNIAAYGKQNFLVLPKDTWISNEFNTIQNTPALKKFYDLFTNTVKENSEYLDVKLLPSFVPNIHNDFIDNIAQNGFFTISGLKDSFEQAITAKSDIGYGVVDEATGEFKKSIPIYYTQAIDAKSKSMDLGRSLFLFGNMALNHKYMSEIESSTTMLQDILERRSKTIITDATGKPVKKPLTGKVLETLTSSDTLDQFNKFVDYYLYGITTTGRDKPIEIKGKNISTRKIFSQTLKWFSAKSLSLNLLSAAANAFGGTSNAYFEGVKGRFYSSKQLTKALTMIGSKNEKAHQLIHYFDVESTKSNFTRANELSASKVTKNVTFDKWYALQKIGEYPVENGTLLAMLQSHTIENGKIIKITKNQTSLFDLAEITNDKVTIKGLTNEEYAKFRRKVKYLYTTMKGNMNADDINTIKLTVLGQALMQFKNWIPRMADERFGSIRYTSDLEIWEQGKYIAMWHHMAQVIHGNFSNLVTGLMANGLFGIGSGSVSNSIQEAAGKKYDSDIDLQSKMTKEEYINMYTGNLKAAALELQMVIAATILIACLKGGDNDDDKDSARKFAIKLANRGLQELNFFINPESASTMIGSGAKSAIPVLGFLREIQKFFSDSIGLTVGELTGNDERIEKNKPFRRLANLFPTTNALERLWEDFIDTNK